MADKENNKDIWEYDKYFDQPKEGLVRQEHVSYKRLENGKLEKTTITRRYFTKDTYVIPSQMDYQDSSETIIL